MYRAVTLRALRRNLPLDDLESVAQIARSIDLDLDDGECVLADGEDVTAAIRSPQVDAAVSAVAANPAVRAALVARQQAWIAARDGAVVEGRDIGSVVAPQADLKVYLTASADERAMRRAAQHAGEAAGVGAAGVGAAAVGAAMQRRDRLDSSRTDSPLSVAPGAVVVDSTGRGVDEVVTELLELLGRPGAAAPAAAGPAAAPPAPAAPAVAPPAPAAAPAATPPAPPAPAAAPPAPAAAPAPPPPPAAAVAAGGLVAGRPIRRGELAFYAACRVVAVGLSRIVYPGPVVGAELLPKEGPYILAPVHRSNLDWLIVARLTRRRLRYIVKDGVWRIRSLGRLIELLGAFPVHRRAADREALNTAISVLAGGEPLVVFPEGTRCDGPKVQEVLDGAAYLSLRAGAPLVPVGLAGTEKAMPRGRVLPRPGRVALVVGQPIRPKVPVPRSADAGSATGAPIAAASRPGHVPRSAVKATTAELVAAMQSCFDRANELLGGPPVPSVGTERPRAGEGLPSAAADGDPTGFGASRARDAPAPGAVGGSTTP
jgi:cytidylate kinase